jgi:hypothetical protein
MYSPAGFSSGAWLNNRTGTSCRVAEGGSEVLIAVTDRKAVFPIHQIELLDLRARKVEPHQKYIPLLVRAPA